METPAAFGSALPALLWHDPLRLGDETIKYSR
jgi:hypothetical protein